MPEISVIIPCYKVEEYLPKCLDSLLNQTFSDFEAICVDDGSPDRCGEILARYAQKDARIKILTEENQGLSMARNNGLKLATGNFVYFLDSDDLMHPQCLEITHALAQKYDADMVSFNLCQNVDDVLWQRRYQADELPHTETGEPFFYGIAKGKKFKIHCTVWTKLFKKSLLDGLEFIPHILFEDYPFIYAVLARKPHTVIIDTPLYFHTVNPVSITQQEPKPQCFADYLKGIGFLHDIFRQPGLETEFAGFKERMLPSLIRQQWAVCRNMPADKRAPMYSAFAAELRELQRKGLIQKRGHKLMRYLTYKFLMWRY